ncbi:hypothetical protein [Aliarcobacter cibarius]|nr:hypothetical protein [Aliarcobacter cibarius]
MRKNSYTQEFKESTVKFCIDNSDRSTSKFRYYFLSNISIDIISSV